MIVDSRELAWAAGIFEGEGSWFMARRTSPRPSQLRAEVTMTDEDTVRRFRQAVGFGQVYPRNPAWMIENNRKPQWRWTGYGFENVQALAAMLWYGLGDRRRERVSLMLREGR